MAWEPIRKNLNAWTVKPNMPDYEEACASFSWDAVRNELAGLPDGGGVNIAHEAVDVHLGQPEQERLAIRWLGKDGTVRDLTFAQGRGSGLYS